MLLPPLMIMSLARSEDFAFGPEGRGPILGVDEARLDGGWERARRAYARIVGREQPGMLRGIEPADGDGRLALTVDLREYGSECLDRIAQVLNVDRCAAVAYGLEAREVVLARLEFFEHFDDLGRPQEGDVRH